MYVARKKKLWTNFLKVKSIERTLLTSSIHTHQGHIVFSLCTLNLDQELNLQRKSHIRSSISLILLVQKEQRRLEHTASNWQKQDISIKVWPSLSKLFWLFLIERGITFHTDKLCWQITLEIHLVETRKQWCSQMFSARPRIWRKQSQHWSLQQEWWKSKIKQLWTPWSIQVLQLRDMRKR